MKKVLVEAHQWLARYPNGERMGLPPDNKFTERSDTMYDYWSVVVSKNEREWTSPFPSILLPKSENLLAFRARAVVGGASPSSTAPEGAKQQRGAIQEVLTTVLRDLSVYAQHLGTLTLIDAMRLPDMALSALQLQRDLASSLAEVQKLLRYVPGQDREEEEGDNTERSARDVNRRPILDAPSPPLALS